MLRGYTPHFSIAQSVKEEVLKHKLNKIENTTFQNLWCAEAAVLRGKFTALNAFIIK